MAFIPVPDAWQINIDGVNGAGHPWTNVYHIVHDDPLTLTQAYADIVAGLFEDAYTSSGLPGLLAAGWAITSATVTDLASDTAPQFVSLEANVTGSDGGQAIPGQSSLVLSWYTALRGRSFRGRSYLNGWTEGQSDGTPSSTAISTSGAYAGDLVANMATQFGAGFGLCVVSRFSGTHLESRPGGQLIKVPTPRTTGLATPITGVNIGDTWFTQRRRRFPA